MKKIQKQIKAHNHEKNKKSVTFIVGNDEFDEEDDQGYNQRKSVVSSELPKFAKSPRVPRETIQSLQLYGDEQYQEDGERSESFYSSDYHNFEEEEELEQ